MPIVHACHCVGLSRSAYYAPVAHWTVRDAQIVAALARLVEGRPNRGFWKCYKILRRKGYRWNHKRVYRVYKQMNLHLRRRAKRRLPKRAVNGNIKLTPLCRIRQDKIAPPDRVG